MNVLEEENEIKVALGRWKELAGIVCNKKMPNKLIIKIYWIVIRPVMIYG